MTVTYEGRSTLYSTRWTPTAGGPYPLRVLEDASSTRKIELLRDASTPEVFDSTRAFLYALHGPRYAMRHWTLDRYLGETVSKIDSDFVIVGPLAPAQFERVSPIVVGPSLPEILVRTPVRGIDLEARGHEVAKLLHAGFTSWIRTSGYDFEDVLQEVYRKILVSNAGTKPWDPAKSSFGHYVHMVCRSALSNYHRKAARVASKEQVGVVRQSSGGSCSAVDAREAALARSAPSRDSHTDPVTDLTQYLLKSRWATHPDMTIALRLLPLLHSGHTLKDAAVLLGVPRPSVSRGLALLRLCARGWAF